MSKYFGLFQKEGGKKRKSRQYAFLPIKKQNKRHLSYKYERRDERLIINCHFLVAYWQCKSDLPKLSSLYSNLFTATSLIQCLHCNIFSNVIFQFLDGIYNYTSWASLHFIGRLLNLTTFLQICTGFSSDTGGMTMSAAAAVEFKTVQLTDVTCDLLRKPWILSSIQN